MNIITSLWNDNNIYENPVTIPDSSDLPISTDCNILPEHQSECLHEDLQTFCMNT